MGASGRGKPLSRHKNATDNEEHSIGSAHERIGVKAGEWWGWALPIEFIELSESMGMGMGIEWFFACGGSGRCGLGRFGMREQRTGEVRHSVFRSVAEAVRAQGHRAKTGLW